MKKLLFALILLSCWMPTKAQATVTAGISCEARSSLRDGARLTYTISGSIEFADDGRILSLLSRNDPNLLIAILRRERNGKERLLRSQERLGNFPSDAPDADYSLIPFSGDFKSSSDSGVYHVRSADRGIYIRMIPANSVSVQIQIVHYLTKSRYVKSGTYPCSLFEK